MTVTFWGTRGSGAAAGRDYVEFGGDTSCVSVEWGSQLAVFDAVTGIGRLGEALAGRGFSGELHLFLSHFHLDHICGLPLSGLVFCPGARLHIYGMGADPGAVQSCISQVLSPPYWPVGPDGYKANVIWHDLKPDETGKPLLVRLENKVPGSFPDLGWQVQALGGNHPDGGLIYRLEAAGRSVVYGLDCELPEDFWPVYEDFAKSADLLIFDAAYTQEEYPSVKGFGHATWQQGVRMAESTGAARTVLIHHRWERTDGELEALDRTVRSRSSKVCFGRDGMKILL